MEIPERWKKTCLCLASDEYDDLIDNLYPGKKIRVHYDMDGLWYSSDIDDEWEKYDDEVAEDIGKHLGIDVTSIHIDDCEYPGVWIVYKEAAAKEPSGEAREKCEEHEVEVRFGMFWEEYGIQTFRGKLPADVDPYDEEDVKDYIRDIWDDIGLPDGGYVEGSANMDEEGPFEIIIHKAKK